MCLRAHRHPTHPFFVVLFACLFCYAGAGLWGVVDVGDELLCFVDQGVAEESGTRQQHQHNTSMMKCGVMFVALDVHVAEVQMGFSLADNGVNVVKCLRCGLHVCDGVGLLVAMPVHVCFVAEPFGVVPFGAVVFVESFASHNGMKLIHDGFHLDDFVFGNAPRLVSNASTVLVECFGLLLGVGVGKGKPGLPGGFGAFVVSIAGEEVGCGFVVFAARCVVVTVFGEFKCMFGGLAVVL